MSNKAVSVIIPVYNTEEYLDQCLDSVTKQSLKDIEIICVDDGSTDGSRAIMDKYANNSDCLTILTTERRGPGFARNLALRRAAGEYIAFIDSDDYICQDMLENMYSTAVKYNSDLVMCTIKRFNDNSSEAFSRCAYDKNIPANLDNSTFTWTDIKETLFDLRFSCCNKLYRKELLFKNEIKFSVGNFYEDMIFTYKALLCAERIRFIRRQFYFNRRQRKGATTFTQGPHVMGAFKAFDELEEFINSKSEFKILKEQFDAFKIKKLIEYLPRNDAGHIGAFYEEMKAHLERSPFLVENSYINDKQRDIVCRIKESIVLDFIMSDYWDLKRRYSILYRKNHKLKKDIDKLKRRDPTRLVRSFLKRLKKISAGVLKQ